VKSKLSSFEFKVHRTDIYEGGGKGLRFPKMYLRKRVPRDLNGCSLSALERVFTLCAKGPFRRALGYLCVCVCVCVCVCIRARAHAILGPCYEAGNDVCQRISFL
jgi:hypothetical protein